MTSARLISDRFRRRDPSDPRPRLPAVLAVQDRQIPYLDAFVEKTRTGEYTLVHSPCPCGAPPDDVVISQTDRYGLPLDFVLCRGCGTIRIDPYLDERSLTGFYVHLYQDMYRRNADLDREWQRQLTYGRRILESVRSWLGSGAVVFEVGCGGGGGLKPFVDAGYRVAGQDYSVELIEYGRRNGIDTLHAGPLAEIVERGLPQADLIYLHHVLEHVDDPVEMLELCRAQLTDTGRVVVIVPDVAQVGRFRYPGGDLLPFLHVAHKFNFSHEGMRRIVRRAGFADALPTPARDAAEMWIELRRAPEGPRYDVGTERQAGKARLDRLKRIERLYRLGLNRGQLLRRGDAVMDVLRRSR